MSKLNTAVIMKTLVSLILLGGLAYGLYVASIPANWAVKASVSEPISGPITPTPTPTPTPSPTPVPDTQSPNISITYPSNGQTIRKGRSINILASASDNVAVDRVEFYVNDSLICTDTSSSYSCSWIVPKKPRVTYTIVANAYDTSGNKSSDSIQVISK